MKKLFLDFATGSITISFIGIIVVAGSVFFSWLFGVRPEIGFIIFIGLVVYTLFSWYLGYIIRREK
jgi:membrane protein implicated in regulation of membrane protease activity